MKISAATWTTSDGLRFDNYHDGYTHEAKNELNKLLNDYPVDEPLIDYIIKHGSDLWKILTPAFGERVD